MSEGLWFGSSKNEYNSNYTCYYSPGDYQWAKTIEDHWPEIKKEVTALITEKDNSFISNDATYKGLESAKGWSSLSSLFWGLNVSDGISKKCPTLFSLLNTIPGLLSVSFSRLESHTQIKEHHGETNAIMRCHLGVEIPAGLPDCGMKVAGEERGWQEGKWLFFNDAQHHTAWNNSEKRRILLIIDAIRPEFLSRKNYICARVLAGHFLTVNKTLASLPRPMRVMIFAITLPAMFIIRPLYNALHLNRMYHD